MEISNRKAMTTKDLTFVALLVIGLAEEDEPLMQ